MLYYLPGLDGSCSYDYQPKGTCKETVTKPMRTRPSATVYLKSDIEYLIHYVSFYPEIRLAEYIGGGAMMVKSAASFQQKPSANNKGRTQLGS